MTKLWVEYFAAHKAAREADRLRLMPSQIAMAWRRANLAKLALEEALSRTPSRNSRIGAEYRRRHK